MTCQCDKPNCPHKAVWDIMTGTGERFCSCGHDLHYMLRTIGVQHGRMVAITPCEVTPERTKPDIVKGDYRQARGCSPRLPGTELPEETIRRQRDVAPPPLPPEEADNA